MKHNLSKKSVSELLQLKEIWLLENEKTLKELAIAVWEFGVHVTEYTREVSIQQIQDLYFVACKDADVIDPKREKKILRYWISVTKGEGNWLRGTQITFYTFFEDEELYGNADKSFSNFVVPGDWLMVAYSIIEAAKIEEDVKEKQEYEKEHAFLLAKLLDGKDI